MINEETEAEFIERKKRLVLALLRYKFEDHMMDVLEEANYNSLEELDVSIEKELKEYDQQVTFVREYYNGLIDKKEKNDG